MNETGIKKLIRNGEGISVEFKECRNKLNKDVFESICAFLNRNGGDLILGVNDNEKDNRHRPRSGGAGQKRAGDRPQ
jgi:predicted HTH transcriptional regulator